MVVAGEVEVAYGSQLTVSNYGTIVVEGLLGYSYNSAGTTVFHNYGTISVDGGRVESIWLWNRSGGVIEARPGDDGRENVVSPKVLENDGVLRVLSGTVEAVGNSASTASRVGDDGVSSGEFSGVGGSLLLEDRWEMDGSTLLGDGVVLAGTLNGQVTVPAGVSFQVSGRLYADTFGLGDLRVGTGGGSNQSVSVHGSLHTASTTWLGGRLDPWQGETLGGHISVESELLDASGTLTIDGVLDFQGSTLMSCDYCHWDITPTGELRTKNTDGAFGHSLDIRGESFDSQGAIRVYGFFPGVDVNVRTRTVGEQGDIVWDGLLDPPWLAELKSDAGFAANAAARVMLLTAFTGNWSIAMLGLGLLATPVVSELGTCQGASIEVLTLKELPGVGGYGSICAYLDDQGDVGLEIVIGGMAKTETIKNFPGPGATFAFDASIEIGLDSRRSDAKAGIDYCGSVAGSVDGTSVSGTYCHPLVSGVLYPLSAEVDVFSPGSVSLEASFDVASKFQAGDELELSRSRSVQIRIPVSCGALLSLDARCPPTSSGPPTIGRIGSDRLEAHAATWTQAPESVEFSWYRCNSVGEGCRFRYKSGSGVYGLSESDAAMSIRVVAHGTNSGGVGSSEMSQPFQVAEGE